MKVLQASACAMYWRAVAGSPVVRIAIQRGAAAQFVESLGPLLSRVGRLDQRRLHNAAVTGSREWLTIEDELEARG